ncbi:MAG: hypothetical protein MHMPM18_002612 [Marteilia pararefringens]
MDHEQYYVQTAKELLNFVQLQFFFRDKFFVLQLSLDLMIDFLAANVNVQTTALDSVDYFNIHLIFILKQICYASLNMFMIEYPHSSFVGFIYDDFTDQIIRIDNRNIRLPYIYITLVLLFIETIGTIFLTNIDFKGNCFLSTV